MSYVLLLAYGLVVHALCRFAVLPVAASGWRRYADLGVFSVAAAVTLVLGFDLVRAGLSDEFNGVIGLVFLSIGFVVFITHPIRRPPPPGEDFNLASVVDGLTQEEFGYAVAAVLKARSPDVPADMPWVPETGVFADRTPRPAGSNVSLLVAAARHIQAQQAGIEERARRVKQQRRVLQAALRVRQVNQ